MAASDSSKFPPREVWTFHTAGQIVYGRNATRQLGELSAQLGCKNALLVTDTILENAGVVQRVIDPLKQANVNVQVFNGGEPEPSMKTALACADAARDFQADVLVAIGGGSNMDLGKITAVLYAHGGHPRDYVGDGNIPGSVTPLICVPTTAGTGSEVSFATVINDNEQNKKVGILSNYLRPRIALVDPLMTVTCPPKVTADSGIDALTHAIEAYTAVDNETFPLPEGERTVYQGRHPLGSCLAEKAIGLIGQFLRRAVKDGNDLEARDGMALAALLAGMAFSNVGVAAVHALEYPLGAAVHAPHGLGNGLLLPYVMRFNMPEREAEFAKIAQLLGQDVTNLSIPDAAEQAIVAVEKLRADIGIPKQLRDIGVKEDQLRGLAESAFGVQRVLRVNPRKPSVDDLEEILRSAY